MRNLPITPKEIDALARLVAREAANQPPEGRLGVLFTVLNRTASGQFGQDIISTIEQKGQFEPMLGKTSWEELPPAPANIHNEVTTALMGFANDEVTDPTKGATFFQNPTVTKARGTNYAKAPAVATIADHAFYNRYGNNDPVNVPAYKVKFTGGSHQPEPLPAQTLIRDDEPLSQDPAAIVRRIQRDAKPEPLTIANAFVSGVDESTSRIGVVAAGDNGYEAFKDSIKTGNTGKVPATQGSFGLLAAGDHVDLSGIDPNLAEAAATAASIFGRDLTATSGFRSAAKQAALKAKAGSSPLVASDSNHTKGSALDLSIKGMAGPEQAALVDALVQAGFTGFGFYNNHMHADMRDSVPKSFGSNDNWGGWTTIPDEAWQVLQRRGFGSGRSAGEVYRGPWQQ